MKFTFSNLNLLQLNYHCMFLPKFGIRILTFAISAFVDGFLIMQVLISQPYRLWPN